MSNSIDSVKRATAGLTRRHSRLSILAASAATAGVLGTAGLAVGSAPWSEAAGGAAQSTTGHSATAFDAGSGSKAGVDATSSAATGGSTVGVTTADVSHGASDHTVKAAADHAVKHTPAKHAPAKHADKPRHKAHAKPAGPYHIWDSVTASALPPGHVAAVYANGSYAVSASQVTDHKSLLWIDTNGSNPGANVLDVEPGDATPAGAAAWAQQRLDKHPHSVAIIYTMLSSWQAVKDHVAHLPKSQQDNVRYWIADPTGVDHIVPGSNATQWYWGQSIDISTANPSLTQPS